jgi:aldose 1-epimerase
VLELTAGATTARVSAEDGGRLASLLVGGRELLVTEGAGPMAWGAFPMVPYAGRVRRGRFRFGGTEYELPITLGPHAIHGVGYDRPWTVLDNTTLEIAFDDRWPLGGRAVARFELSESALTWTLEVHADRPMPAQAGWHPWFRKPADLRFAAHAMYTRDDDGIPSGELQVPTPGPWDDCFTKLLGPPQLAFPDGPTLVITSTCDHWVVYTEPEHAVCVEPQSGPPDGFTLLPQVIEPGAPLVESMTLRW